MSEDRHTFSEPRPIAGLTLPAWDVDVFRDGVPEPILTLRVDETTLPPRRSKKKKIAWRLPETVDQVPRFGADEKRRLLDIFKSLKKERRKSKRGSETGGSDIGLNDADDGGDIKGSDAAMAASENDTPEAAKQNGNSIAANANNIVNNNNNNIGSQPETQNGTSHPPHQQTKDPDRISTNGTATVTATSANSTTMGMERLSVGQPTTSSVPPAPPPGMIHMADRSQSMPEVRPSMPMPPPGLAPPPPPPPHQQLHPPMPAPGLGPAATSPLPTNPSLLPPPSRFFTIPPTMPQEIFAQQVANLYISLLQTGQIEELMLYYAMTAQKSLSLKSAKSICATPLERKTQLQSLVGCAFVVQGITVQVQPPALQQQQQPPNPNIHNNDYILLIWSGICQVQGQQHGFCHTLILAPLTATATTNQNGTTNNGSALPRGYQIQNDALVLLANE